MAFRNGPSQGSCGRLRTATPRDVDDVVSDPLGRSTETSRPSGSAAAGHAIRRRTPRRCTFAVLSRQPGTPRRTISASSPRSHTWQPCDRTHAQRNALRRNQQELRQVIDRFLSYRRDESAGPDPYANASVLRIDGPQPG